MMKLSYHFTAMKIEIVYWLCYSFANHFIQRRWKEANLWVCIKSQSVWSHFIHDIYFFSFKFHQILCTTFCSITYQLKHFFIVCHLFCLQTVQKSNISQFKRTISNNTKQKKQSNNCHEVQFVYFILFSFSVFI